MFNNKKCLIFVVLPYYNEITNQGDNIMKGLKATILDLGYNYSDGNFFEAGKYEPGTHLTNTPFYGILLDHPTEGLILFDTGDPDKNDWPEFLRPLCDVVDEPGKNIPDQLALLGLKPEDVKHVILSHLHIDHIGGLRHLKNAKVYCTRKEFESAKEITKNGDVAFYIKSLVDSLPEDVVLLGEEDVELFEGVHIINAPGHTLGLIAMRVELESGDILETSDATNMASNFYEGVPGGIVLDPEAAKASVEKLHRIQKENNIPNERVLFSHDDVQYARTDKAPKWF